MSDKAWCNFGVVAGVLWIRGLGIAFKPYGPLDGFRTPRFTAYRLWPFVVVWVPADERV